MAERVRLSDVVDDALEAMMANPGEPLSAADPHVRDLLEIASELTLRPTTEYKERLKAELMQKRRDVLEAASDRLPFRVEPCFPVRDAKGLIAFLVRAFAAEEKARFVDDDGFITHAELEIGDSMISVSDADAPGHLPAMPTAIHLYVPDADTVYERAVAAGATSLQKPTDQPYGDREGGVRDAFGNNWYIGTHTAGGGEAHPHIPAGLKTVNSYLHPRGAAGLIDFLKRAFGAEETFRADAPDGSVPHAKIRIGESIVEMGEAQGPYQPMPTVYHLYVGDTDAVYRRAVAAGGESLGEPTDQPWGMRSGGIRDPGGNQWWINAPLSEEAKATPREERESAATITPFLIVHDVRATSRFLQDAFDAELVLFDRGGDPPHDHAELRIGESMLMMGESIANHLPTLSAFYLNVADVEAAYQRALRAGATSIEPPQQKPWGARMAHVTDPLGNSWYIASK